MERVIDQKTWNAEHAAVPHEEHREVSSIGELRRGAGWSRGARGLAFVIPGLALLAAGCTDGIPTASDPGLIPVDAETFIVELPFAQFASDVRVDGGYGLPGNLPAAILARTPDGEESRPLVQWGAFPTAISVPQGEGTASVLDSTWTVLGGELVVRVDSARVSDEGVFDIEARQVLEPFDVQTASWTMAVDTLGERRSWTVPGGGATEPVGVERWVPLEGDSLVFSLDSLTATRLGDRSVSNRAVLLRSQTDSAYLRVFDAFLRLEVRPSSRPDTTIFVQPLGTSRTFIQSADPDQGPDVLAVGGAPAFRSSFRLSLPAQVTASGSVCGGPPTCQIELTAERIVFAGLELTTVPTSTALLQPADTVALDLRPVLAPQLLPRAPLGLPIQTQFARVAPSAFGGEAGTTVELSVTRFLRDLVRGPEEGGEPVPSTVSLLAGTEPSGLGIATFGGPGSATPPRLRLILTRSEGVSLP
jgi:hypothetical protein